MRLFTLALISGLALSSCGQISQIEAVAQCLEKLESVFPAAKGLSDQDISEDIVGFGEDNFNGRFSFTVPAPDGSVFWTCKGNVESRRIDEVGFKGAVKKPANAEVWSY